MAIDSSLYVCSIAANTVFAKGDTVKMTCIRGPTVVRDGYGKAILKKVFVCEDGGSQPVGHCTIKNSNWIDEMANFAVPLSTSGNFILADNSAAIQRGGDMQLMPNSSWDIEYHLDEAITVSVDYDVYVLIDIDYPEVAAVENPNTQTGAPITMMDEYSVTTNVYGTAASAVWTEINVDVFKAGYRYLLAQIGGKLTSSSSQLGFFSIRGAAGQAGLERLIPFPPSTVTSQRYNLEYSTPLVKGPMTMSFMIMGSAGTDTLLLETDYIRRG